MSDYWKDNNIEKPDSYVVCAAMFKDDRIITGARHFDKVMRDQMEASEGIAWWKNCKQGFINQFGEFLTREEAWVIADKNGQINLYDPAGHNKRIAQPANQGTEGILFSENLY